MLREHRLQKLSHAPDAGHQLFIGVTGDEHGLVIDVGNIGASNILNVGMTISVAVKSPWRTLKHSTGVPADPARPCTFQHLSKSNPVDGIEDDAPKPDILAASHAW